MESLIQKPLFAENGSMPAKLILRKLFLSFAGLELI